MGALWTGITCEEVGVNAYIRQMQKEQRSFVGQLGAMRAERSSNDNRNTENNGAEKRSAESVRYRFITRSDLDGLASGVLLKHLGLIDEVLFVHPKDMQDGKVAVTDRDITTNLPYVDGVALCFDHHRSESLRLQGGQRDNHIIDTQAPSAARVVYEYFGGAKRFPREFDPLIAAADKADSAQFSVEEIRNPRDWVLLNFILDPRTGLGRFRNFRISNYQLMINLIDYLHSHLTMGLSIGDILSLPNLKERVDLYFAMADVAKEQLASCAEVYGDLVMVDLRDEVTIYPTNRFTLYGLFPECNISMHVLWDKTERNVVYAVGKSIINKSSKVDVGALMLKYGGGGHRAAGTCQIPKEHAPRVFEELKQALTAPPCGLFARSVLVPLRDYLNRIIGDC